MTPPVTFDSVSVGDRVRSPSFPYTVYVIMVKGIDILQMDVDGPRAVRHTHVRQSFDDRRFERVVLG